MSSRSAAAGKSTEIEAPYAGIDGVSEFVVVSSGTAGRLGAVVSVAGPASPELQARVRGEVERVNASVEQHRRIGALVFVDHPIQADPRFQTGNMKLRRAAVQEYFAELSSRPEETR